MSYTTPAIREARRQCREERMRQGLDRHLVNEGEVYERANLISQLEISDALIELSVAPELIMAGSMLGPVFKRPAPGKLHQCLRMLGPRTVTRGAQVD